MHFKSNQLPDSERPYEKFLTYGPSALSDAELLAIIIKSGSKEQNSVELAQMLLADKQRNLLNLFDYSLEEFTAFSGIGKVKAIQLKAIAELAIRIAQTNARHEIRLNDPSSVADYYMQRMRHEPREHIIVSMFDTKCHLIADTVISVGSVDASYTTPREIFLKAFEKKAVSIIVLHNHPSGIPYPSIEDQRLTERIQASGELIGIPLIDHIIIGNNEYYSFRENGLLKEQRS